MAGDLQRSTPGPDRSTPGPDGPEGPDRPGAGTHQELIARAAALPPLRTAVVWPMDALSLRGAREAARAGLLEPVLVGDPAGLRDLGGETDIEVEDFEVVEAETSAAAAATAVSLVRRGEVQGLMKGALHTDTLMRPVVDTEKGLATERRVSHAFVMDVPSYARPLFISDAAIHIHPDLEDKRDIVQNVVDMARALGVERPAVAVLSAVETVTSQLRSTVDAAALCKMAQRGQIRGCEIDGPLAFDTAVSSEAARRKGLDSPVAGKAQLLIVPDLEAGNLLYKQLEYLGGARIAGIALGARVPIVLTSRADDVGARVASSALAALLADARAAGAAGGPVRPPPRDRSAPRDTGEGS